MAEEVKKTEEKKRKYNVLRMRDHLLEEDVTFDNMKIYVQYVVKKMHKEKGTDAELAEKKWFGDTVEKNLKKRKKTVKNNDGSETKQEVITAKVNEAALRKDFLEHYPEIKKKVLVVDKEKKMTDADIVRMELGIL